jgi:uncharacterized protein YgfB (UPF0149 family)
MTSLSKVDPELEVDELLDDEERVEELDEEEDEEEEEEEVADCLEDVACSLRLVILPS